ncbi:DUF3618 domain-containing protein [Sinosporangium siamense]|uniref:DUF3618 domain-containing protein n=1 Tax=Sinosporangium siamense TaxID=1367973 RepID=A0A919RF93_9ACTN|nr:DUF3618 domain-containing protein [Sinosporangium siamense]GII91334.1 hypothetical protein Ssi02_15650 [Sinosporangium siamense]
MAETNPEELERRIERTRAELARTVDEIAERVHPRRVAERSVAKVKANAEHFMASVGDAVGLAPRDHRAEALKGEPDDDLWEDERPSLAPVLIGVGAVLIVGAAVVLWRRRRR